jgi:hypothetical protein
MEARPIDSWDTKWEVDSPVYRVYFWERQKDGGYWSDEFELHQTQLLGRLKRVSLPGRRSCLSGDHHKKSLCSCLDE